MLLLDTERDPARFRRRIPGHLPGQGQCHSLMEVSLNARFLLVHLASVSRFTIAIQKGDVLDLLHLLADPRHAQVPVWNGDSGRYLHLQPYHGPLPLPYRDKPVELHLTRDIRIVFRADELRKEATTGYLHLVDA